MLASILALGPILGTVVVVTVTGLSLGALYALGRLFLERAESAPEAKPVPAPTPPASEKLPVPTAPAPPIPSKPAAPKGPEAPKVAKPLDPEKARQALLQAYPLIDRQGGFKTPQAKADADKLARAVGYTDYESARAADFATVAPAARATEE